MQDVAFDEGALMSKHCSRQMPEVFVEFVADKAENTKVVLFNSDCANGICEREILNRYSYVVNALGVDTCVGKIVKTFYAERYGGDFISRNGGGGRCGYDGLFQLKGIGKTPLVGSSVDEFHSNGMLDLESAIHEMIWGEVIHLALPFGAARSVAVIMINEKFVVDGVIYQRALLVREAVVRPAHFERAILFKEKLNDGVSLCNDALRVKTAIQQLIEFLPTLDELEFSDFPVDKTIKLRSGLAALAMRFAEQFAVARCKNIMHMMMSSSNLTMSGAWLDLNSVTIVSPISVREKRLYRRFEMEHHPSIRSLINICYYAKKYFPLPTDIASEILENALKIFDECYEISLRKGVLMRVGFPECIVAKMKEREEFTYFSDLLLSLMRHQSYEVGVEKVFGGLRFYSLPDRPHVSDCTFDQGVLSVLIEWRVSNVNVKNELSRVFELFLQSAVKEAGVPRTELLRIICLNLTKQSRTPVLLQNIKLYDLLSKIIQDGDSDLEFRNIINSLMCEARDAAEICLATDSVFSSLVWRSGKSFIRYDGLVDKFCVSFEGACNQLTWAQLEALDDDLPMAKSTIDFYQSVKGAFLDL